MKIALRNVYSGSPSLTALVSVTMIPALPLSYIASIDPVSVALPSTGTSRCRVTAWVPWTTIAGLNVPAFFNAEPIVPQPITTGNVGSTRCWTPLEFSVVKASSSVPAPTPTAYNRASLLSQLTSTGSLSVPTASGLSGIAADYERPASPTQPERDRPRVG